MIITPGQISGAPIGAILDPSGRAARRPPVIVLELSPEQRARIERALASRCGLAPREGFVAAESPRDVGHLVDPGARQLLIVGEPASGAYSEISDVVYPSRERNRSLVAAPLWFRPRDRLEPLSQKRRTLVEIIYDAPEIFEEPAGDSGEDAYASFLEARVRGFLDGTWPKPRGS
jgi:hypothetical protein